MAVLWIRLQNSGKNCFKAGQMLYWCFRRNHRTSLALPGGFPLGTWAPCPFKQFFHKPKISSRLHGGKIALSFLCSKWVTPWSLPQSFPLLTVYLPVSASPKDCLFCLPFLPIQFNQSMLFMWVQWVERGCRCLLGRFSVSEELAQLREAGKGSFHRNFLQGEQRAW